MMHNQNTVMCAGKKPRWLRIGVAFPHDRGAGLTVVLNALPLNFDGRISF